MGRLSDALKDWAQGMVRHRKAKHKGDEARADKAIAEAFKKLTDEYLGDESKWDEADRKAADFIDRYE
jgi:hypothetical protein